MISLTDKARDYLLTKGGAAYLFETGPTILCCGRIDIGPCLQVGVPQNRGPFREQVINGVRVYLPRDFDSPYPIIIDLHSHFGVKTVCVSGWKLD